MGLHVRTHALAVFLLCAVLGGAWGLPRSETVPDDAVVLSNNVMDVVVGGEGITVIKDHVSPPPYNPGALNVTFTNDVFEIDMVYNAQPNNVSWNFSSLDCDPVALRATSTSEAKITYLCTPPTTPTPRRVPLAFTVVATYTLYTARAAVSKTLTISSSSPHSALSGGVFRLLRVAPFVALSTTPGLPTSTSTYTHANPFESSLSIASFLRYNDLNRGFFCTVANPFGAYTLQSASATSRLAPNATSTKITAAYSPNFLHRPSWLHGESHTTDAAIIGLTHLSRYSVSKVNTGERAEFVSVVRAELLDTQSRKDRSVKVNVAWDESDYQIDVGTVDGVTEYKRIIDRNADMGVTHVVYEPRNTLHSDRFNSTDGWGWEGSLWFAMGERIRQGVWLPQSDAVPEEIQDMVKYADSKGVKLLAYVYPCLAMEAPPHALIGGTLDLSAEGAAEWTAETLEAFMSATAAGGFAWDHNIFAGGEELRYGQWWSWMAILAHLRSKFPDMVMDHRQTAHMWGPWYHMAGSYAEPIAGDENPETYGVPITSLHTDHVAANNLRLVNHKYSSDQLIPAERVPGFIFHQTERTADNGTNPCFGNVEECFDNNTRDFDLLGYKYSLLSSISLAGLNNVFCMIPARDSDEFSLFPKEDLAFVREWMDWTDKHTDILAHSAPIATLPAPALGSVDGSAAFALDDSVGFVFLFNPNMVASNAPLTVDESMGISNFSSQASFQVEVLFPPAVAAAGTYNHTLWKHGQAVTVPVPPSEALVLQLTRTPPVTPPSANAPVVDGDQDQVVWDAPQLVGVGGEALKGRQSRALQWIKAQGVSGSEVIARVIGGTDLDEGDGLTEDVSINTLSINGVPCSGLDSSTKRADATNAHQLQPEGHLPQRSSNTVRIRFAKGDGLVEKAQPLALPPPGNTGGNLTAEFEVSSAVFTQLEKRQNAYPIPWQAAELNATWLVPSRLLASIFIARPADSWSVHMSIDGVTVPVQRSYNSRGLVRPRCFLGYYVDLSAARLVPDVKHLMHLQLPEGLPMGAFQGVFLENVETELTDVVQGCHIE